MDRSPNLILLPGPGCSLPRELAVFLVFSPLVFCADYQIEANIRYSQYPETVLDIIQSPAPALKNRPGVIVIHGAGDKAGMLEKFCVPFAQHDFVVANVEYRSAEPSPAPLSDVAGSSAMVSQSRGAL